MRHTAARFRFIQFDGFRAAQVGPWPCMECSSWQDRPRRVEGLFGQSGVIAVPKLTGSVVGSA
jgi:hypothetical protein